MRRLRVILWIDKGAIPDSSSNAPTYGSPESTALTPFTGPEAWARGTPGSTSDSPPCTDSKLFASPSPSLGTRERSGEGENWQARPGAGSLVLPCGFVYCLAAWIHFQCLISA
ncbi:hypothetical protein U1Q18_003409 [Sarracenia purpurea var. burkii]